VLSLVATPEARAALEKLNAYLCSEAGAPDAFVTALTGAGDLVQLLLDDKNLVPIVHVVGKILSPDFGKDKHPDYSLVDGSVLGAFQLQLIAHKLGDSELTALDLALGWRADALWIYAGPNDETVWIWLVELSDVEHADALVSLSHNSGTVHASSSHARVVLVGDGQPEFVVDASNAFLSEPSP